MMTLYCDESDDGRTYALAGWLGVPSAWDRFNPAWEQMLSTIEMPDGSPCPAFHTADIVHRRRIKGSPFKGWTRKQEREAFDKAIAVIADRRNGANIWPVGVALEMPSSFTWISRDGIWLMLFIKLFMLLGETFHTQRSIALRLDEKKAIQNNALKIHSKAKEVFNRSVGEEYLSCIGFDDDAKVPPLQAADLLAYEWRKRITDAREHPQRPVRSSYQRIREARPEQATLWRYGQALFEEALQIDPVVGDQSTSYFCSVMERPPTHRD